MKNEGMRRSKRNLGQRTAKSLPQSCNLTSAHFESHVSPGSKPWTQSDATWSGNEAGPLAQTATGNAVLEEVAEVVANSAAQRKTRLVSGPVLQNANESIVCLVHRKHPSCLL